MKGQKVKQLLELIDASDAMIKRYRDSIRNLLKTTAINLSFDQINILLKVFSRQGISQLKLSIDLNRDPASISRTIKILVDQNYIQRKQAGKERKLYLTPKSIDTIQIIEPMIRKNILSFGVNAHEKEIAIIKELLSRLQ